MADDAPNYGARYFWSALFASAALAVLIKGSFAVAAALLVPAVLILLRVAHLRRSTQQGSDETYHAWIVLLTTGLLCFSLGWLTLGSLLAGPAVTAFIRDWWTWLRSQPSRRVKLNQRRCAKCVPTRGGYCANCGHRLSRP